MVAATAAACGATINPASIADAQTAARVKSALVNDPDIGIHPIEVRVANGVARLTGRVPTEGDAARAVALAEVVPGVVEVRSELRVGGAPDEMVRSAPAPTDVTPSLQDQLGVARDRRLLAVGVSFGQSVPSGDALDPGTAFGPLIRVGGGRGLGVSVGLGWYSGPLIGQDSTIVAGRVRIRPVMGGLRYTVRNDRLSMSVSAVGGIAFNSVSPADELAPELVAIQVGNSLVWRPAVTLWVETSHRTAVSVSAGYAMTRPRVTTLEAGEVVRRRLKADAFLLGVGLVYKLF